MYFTVCIVFSCNATCSDIKATPTKQSRVPSAKQNVAPRSVSSPLKPSKERFADTKFLYLNCNNSNNEDPRNNEDDGNSNNADDGTSNNNVDNNEQCNNSTIVTLYPTTSCRNVGHAYSTTHRSSIHSLNTMNETQRHSSSTMNEGPTGNATSHAGAAADQATSASFNTRSNLENQTFPQNIIVDEINPPQATFVQTNCITINFCEKPFTIDVSNKRNRCVINLSTRPLSEIEVKFCPTPGEPDMY